MSVSPRAVLCALLLAGVGGCASLHTLEEGAAYRSAGMNEQDLERVISEKQIATVVNLSGFAPSADWYRRQKQVCNDNNVTLIDLELDPNGPNREEVIELLNAYHMAQKPILIHANRNRQGVGLAAGLYRLAEGDGDKKAARSELPFWCWRQSPITRFQAHDRFLYEWRNEDEFYATYQIEGPVVRSRPDATADRMPAGGAESSEPPPSVSLGKPF